MCLQLFHEVLLIAQFILCLAFFSVLPSQIYAQKARHEECKYFIGQKAHEKEFFTA